MSVRMTTRVMLPAALAACLGSLAYGQEGNSLGDLARQTRAQHAGNEGKSSKAQDLVDEMQQEQEAADNAPVGFKNYDAGEYRIFVPFPYSLEGRENGGAVLMGSRVGVTNTEVLAGTPVPIRPNLRDVDVSNLVRQVAQTHSQNAYCTPTQIGTHKAFHCSMNKGTLLGREVWGDMEIIVATNQLIPIMCVSPDELTANCAISNGYRYNNCGNPYQTWQQLQKQQAETQTRLRDERTTAQVCEQIIYPSIQLKEDIVVHPASIAEGKTAKPRAPVTQDTTVAASSQGPALADLARQTRQTPHPKPLATLDNGEGVSLAPAGFQSFVLQYCRNPQQCSEASVVIPEKSEVVSRTNGQHIFKTSLNGNPVMLYAGPADVNAPYRSLTDVDYIRMRDLANANGWSREKADGVSTQELTIDGKRALMTRFRYLRDQKNWWIGERVLIELYPTQFLLGCTAPEDHFADAEALCTTLVNSLRLQ